MREIKFRAWDEETKQLLIVNSLTLDFGLCDLWNGKPEDEGVAKKLSDVNLMQYTGLKDKNGVEIYESDVVKFNFIGREEGTSEVKWEYGEWNVTDFSEKVRISDNIHEAADIEVIGNIYQNPELLI